MNKLPIVQKVIELIPFSGVSDNTLLEACTELKTTESFCKFPNGILDVVEIFETDITSKMQKDLQTEITQDHQMKVRDKIQSAIQIRLSHYKSLANYRELLKQLYSFYILPNNICFTNKILFNISSNVWYSIGDNSTDFNYYTKRFIFTAIYFSTILYFINDFSHQNINTTEFLNRRIENVMSFHKIKSYVKSFMPNFRIFNVEFNKSTHS